MEHTDTGACAAWPFAILLLGGCAEPGAPIPEPGGIASGLGTETGSTTTEAAADTEKLDLGADRDVPEGDTDEACAATMIEPEIVSQRVDVLVVVDTSNSMAEAIAAVEASINADFAAILEASGVDYRVIVAGDYPPGEQLDICITTPLSTTDCASPPAVPPVTERYKHYDAITGSGAFLDNIIAWATTPDPHGLAPAGFLDFFREDSRKVILAMTDGTSASDDTSLGEAFDAQLLAFQPPVFGSAGDRRYVFHTITSMAANAPSTTPWLPADPIQGEAASIQQVSVVSGGWRFPLSHAADFDVVFQEIAQQVVETTPIACSFPIPDPGGGETIDPNTIEIDYSPGGVPPLQSFHQVTGLATCEPDAFYIDANLVVLCPEACGLVQGDPMAQLDVRYGCDVGFDPEG